MRTIELKHGDFTIMIIEDCDQQTVRRQSPNDPIIIPKVNKTLKWKILRETSLVAKGVWTHIENPDALDEFMETKI